MNGADIELGDISLPTHLSPDNATHPFVRQRVGTLVLRTRTLFRVSLRLFRQHDRIFQVNVLKRAERTQLQTNVDRFIQNDLGLRCLKENYLKIANESNGGILGKIFAYMAAAATDGLRFEDYESWSICLERFVSTLQENETASLQVCVIAAETKDVGRAYSFIHKLFTVSHDRLQQAYSTPKEIVTQIVRQQWNLNGDLTAQLVETLNMKESSLPAWQPKLPSRSA